MTIPIHLTEISTFEWSENEKSVTKPPFWEASSRRVAFCRLGLRDFYEVELSCHGGKGEEVWIKAYQVTPRHL